MKQANFKFKYKGKEFNGVCTFKPKLKKFYFRIKNNIIYASAPFRSSLKEVINLLETNISNKFLDKLLISNTQQINDSYFYLFGRQYDIEELQAISNDAFGFTFETMEQFKKKIKKYVLEKFTSRVRYFEEIMGVYPPYKVAVRNTSTRLGSNSRKTHTISLTFNLIHYNMNVIDSVVVHELAHHFHFNHSKEFYDVVYKYCPEYKKMRSILLKGVYK